MTLSAAQQAEFLALWRNPDATVAHIGRTFGFSCSTARDIARRIEAGEKARCPHGANGSWTDERCVELERLLREGLSASQIAKQLGGVTRNAVIGKAYRLGFAVPAQPARPRARPPARVAGAIRPKPYIIAGNGAVIEKPDAGPPRVATRPDAFVPLPGTTPVPWTQRGFGQCCWPVDLIGVDEQHSCAAKCGEGQRYCDAHLTMRAQPQDPGKAKRSVQELIRGLRRYA